MRVSPKMAAAADSAGSGCSPGSFGCEGPRCRGSDVRELIKLLNGVHVCERHAVTAMITLANAAPGSAAARSALALDGPRAVLKWLQKEPLSEVVMAGSLAALAGFVKTQPWSKEVAEAVFPTVCAVTQDKAADQASPRLPP